MAFTEVLKLKFDPAGVTQGLSKARGGLRDTKAGMDALKTGFKVAGTAIAAVLTVIGANHEKARATIAAATGAVGKDLEGLKTDYFAVLKTVRFSTDAVAKAIGDLNTHTAACRCGGFKGWQASR